MVDSGLTRIELKLSRGDGYYPALILNKKFLFIKIYLLFINIKIYFFKVHIFNF